MKSDRELLEAAAKAAGIPAPFQVLRDGTWVFDEPRVKNWNPLTSDGDALRLAVRLKIRVTVDDFSAHADYRDYRGDAAGESYPIGADPYAATRRAIVRAAATLAEAQTE